METPVAPKVKAASQDEEPIISFARLIALAPSSSSFAGWGVRV